MSTASSYNLIGTGGSGGLTAGNSTGNLLNTASANVGLASALAANGGLTPTIALLPGSRRHQRRQCEHLWGDRPQHRPARFSSIGRHRHRRLPVGIGAERVYVDSAWAGDSPGTQVFFPGDSVDVHYIGFDAFATIQSGVSAVASGGFVHVAPGTYNEAGDNHNEHDRDRLGEPGPPGLGNRQGLRRSLPRE